MNPALPGARWHPTMHSQRPYIGQGAPSAPVAVTLTTLVLKDGAPLAGVAVEVMFQSGESAKGVTDGTGKFVTPVAAAQKGQTVVRITPPEGVQDIGEGAAQGVNLVGAPAQVQFDLVGVTMAHPLVGLGVAGLLYGLVLGAL
jgi:hypothetical protein